jgi:site-specific recombinase XerD
MVTNGKIDHKNPWKSYTFSPQEAPRMPTEITSLEQAVTLFLESRKSKKLSPHTVRSYKSTLAQVLTIADGAWPVTREHIYLWRHDPDTEKQAATTINKYLLVFRVFWKWLRSTKLTKLDDPSEGIDGAKEDKIDPRIPTKEEIKTLLRFCRPTEEGERLKAIIQIIVDTGLRIDEFTHLRWHDVNWDEKTLKVKGKGDKSRLVPFGSYTERILKRRWDTLANPIGADYIYQSKNGTALTQQWAQLALRRLSWRAQIGWAVHPHALRHYAATDMVRRMQVTIVQKILGHEHVETTMRYVHLAGVDIREAHRTASPGDWLWR